MCATDDARPVKDCLDEAAPHSLVDPPGLDVGDDERPQRARRRLDHGGARREVLEGGMEADLAQAAAETLERRPFARATSQPRLTGELLAEGLPNKAIAARLGISDQTVKFHVSSICGKLGASNRTAAVRRAVRRGLITL